jgi:hypothetical protein
MNFTRRNLDPFTTVAGLLLLSASCDLVGASHESSHALWQLPCIQPALVWMFVGPPRYCGRADHERITPDGPLTQVTTRRQPSGPGGVPFAGRKL